MRRIVSSTGVPSRRSGAMTRSPVAGAPLQQTPTPKPGPVASGRMPMMTVNSSGEVFLSHTKLDGRFVLRLAIGHLHTAERHVARAWELLNSHA